MTFSVVVLAAGKGTRMKSSLPKVLHPIGGKPMVQHIVDTVNKLGATNIHVIYGHGREQLQNKLSHNDLSWCLQEQQLGTGHAVQQAIPPQMSSCNSEALEVHRRRISDAPQQPAVQLRDDGLRHRAAVSYPHLTLPTIYSS